METQPTISFWQKNKLVIKSFFISFLVLALLIPTFLIMYLFVLLAVAMYLSRKIDWYGIDRKISEA